MLWVLCFELWVVCCGLCVVCCGWCVVGCGFCVVVTVCANGIRDKTICEEIPSKISPESMKIWSWGVLGPFWVAGRAKVGPRMAPRIPPGN